MTFDPKDASHRESEMRGDAGTVRIRDGLPFCLAIFLCARILLSLLGVVGVDDASPDTDTEGVSLSGAEVPATPGWHNALDGTNRFDAAWFIAISEDGYSADDESAAFFPGFPLAIRAASWMLPGDTLVGALAVSNALFLVGLVVLYALTAMEFDEGRARRTIALVAFFPSSLFFLAPYSESFFLAAVVLTFWWSRRDKPVFAGLAGFVAVGVKSVGFVVVPALLVEAAVRSESRRELARRLAYGLLPLLALAAYGAFWLGRTRDALEPLAAQDAWTRSLQFPVITIGEAISLGAQGITDARGIWWTLDLVVTAALLIPFLHRFRELRLSYQVFVGLSLLIPLTFPFPPRPFMSMPRFVIVLFPMFWSLAGELSNLRAFIAVLIVSIAGYSVLAISFMNWGPVF
ncbi:MAG: mannosyltransferase family protein [Gaiellaceae bacterium]